MLPGKSINQKLLWWQSWLVCSFYNHDQPPTVSLMYELLLIGLYFWNSGHTSKRYCVCSGGWGYEDYWHGQDRWLLKLVLHYHPFPNAHQLRQRTIWPSQLRICFRPERNDYFTAWILVSFQKHTDASYNATVYTFQSQSCIFFHYTVYFVVAPSDVLMRVPCYYYY